MTITRDEKKYKAQGTRHKAQNIRVGVDTGGTFTDFVFEKNGRLNLFKLPSTPSDPSQAITDGLKRICNECKVTFNQIEVVHGTTVGTNALLQRRGARVALVTTKGFEDGHRTQQVLDAARASNESGCWVKVD
jgi:N-methylhydantoinase A